MNAKEYLSRLIKLNNKIKKMEDLAEFYRRKMCSVSGSSICVIGNDPSPSYESNNMKYLCYLDEQERKIKKAKEEYTKVEKEILSTLNELDDDLKFKVLFLRYVEQYEWPTIVTELGLSRSYIFKQHSDGLISVDNIIKMRLNET